VDSAGGALARIDPATHAVVQQIPVGSAPSAVTVTGPDAWVSNSFDGTVSRVSTVTNRVVETISVGNFPVAIAAGRGGVWVVNQGDGTVDRIDAVTGDVTKRGIQVGARPGGIAAGPDAVWVANGEDGTVQRIDPATGQPGGPVHVGCRARGHRGHPGRGVGGQLAGSDRLEARPGDRHGDGDYRRRRRAGRHRRGQGRRVGEQ
jgi:serine/threonine-protein kinase